VTSSPGGEKKGKTRNLEMGRGRGECTSEKQHKRVIQHILDISQKKDGLYICPGEESTGQKTLHRGDGSPRQGMKPPCEVAKESCRHQSGERT